MQDYTAQTRAHRGLRQVPRELDARGSRLLCQVVAADWEPFGCEDRGRSAIHRSNVPTVWGILRAGAAAG